MDLGSVPLNYQMELKMEILQVFRLFLNFSSYKTFAAENVLEKFTDKLRSLIQAIF